MENSKILVDFFLQAGGHTKIRTCKDVDKWADELQKSFKEQDKIDAELKKEKHNLNWWNL